MEKCIDINTLFPTFDFSSATESFFVRSGDTSVEFVNAIDANGDLIYINELRDINAISLLAIGDSGFSVYEKIIINGSPSRYQVLAGYNNSPGLTLTAISNTSPVPEPATILLFGTGLVSLARYRRKQAKQADKSNPN